MSQRWIKMRADLPTDPEVLMIATDTKTDPLDVCGRLLLLWGIADAHADETKEGLMSGTHAMVDKSVRVKGFSAAMEAVGWIEFHDNGKMSFPGYVEHNGSTAKLRGQAQKRMVKKRKRVQPVTEPLRSARNNSVTTASPEEIRLEEIREYKTEEKTGTGGTIDFSMIWFPDGLYTPEVRQAITRWIDHLTIRNMPPFDPEQHIGFALKRFAGKQPRDFIEQIEWSIEAGTMKTIAGPRPERQNNNSGGSRPITAEEVVERLRVGREEDERRAEYQEQGQGKGDIPI